MSNTIKIGIIFIACILGTLSLYANNQQNVTASSDTEKITWDNSLMLPDTDGKANPGLAGAFSGFIGSKLVIAGGANFPDATPWNGGHKTWWNTLYYIDVSNPAAQWNIIEDGLPRALAYGSSIQLPSGILCIGGCDSARCYSEVFQLRLTNGKIEIDTGWPSLPVPLSNAAATLLDNKIYIAGGQERMDAQEANRHFFVLDLADTSQGWKTLPAWPGEPRGYAVAAAQSDGFDKCFYLFGGRTYKADGYIKVLTDGYVYNPRLNIWKKLEQTFPVMAGTALATGANHILFMGGVPKLIPGSDSHPGFDNTVRLYHTVTNTLIEKEVVPYPVAVTTNIARKDNIFYLTSGEIKPGIRTPHLLRGEIKAKGD